MIERKTAPPEEHEPTSRHEFNVIYNMFIYGIYVTIFSLEFERPIVGHKKTISTECPLVCFYNNHFEDFRKTIFYEYLFCILAVGREDDYYENGHLLI